MIGTSRRLVHTYADINDDISWSTATEARAKLLMQVNSALGGNRPLLGVLPCRPDIIPRSIILANAEVHA